MNAPERISINLNAADGYERFLASGMDVRHSDDLTPQRIVAMLSSQKGKLFRLLGWAGEALPHVTLRIDDVQDDVLQFTSSQPPFSAEYSIAAEPPPRVSAHGDYLFDLVRI